MPRSGWKKTTVPASLLLLLSPPPLGAEDGGCCGGIVDGRLVVVAVEGAWPGAGGRGQLEDVWGRWGIHGGLELELGGAVIWSGDATAGVWHAWDSEHHEGFTKSSHLLKHVSISEAVPAETEVIKISIQWSETTDSVY